MRVAFIETLISLARRDNGIFLLVGDVGYSMVEPFYREFPDRFINVGIAEQNMIGIATGLALCGKTVFAYSIANFPTLRCIEQIRNDICYHNASVKIVSSGGGLMYGALGTTHHVTEDMAILRSLPNMLVVVPADPVEAALATVAVAEYAGPCYLRLGRINDPPIHQAIPDFHIGKAIRLRDGRDITLIASGGIVYNVVLAAEQLAQGGIESSVLNMHTVKPVDKSVVISATTETGAIVTIEEHSVIGGLGSAVAEVLAQDCRHNVPFMRIGVPDEFCHYVGNQERLRELYSLSVDGIVSAVKGFVAQGKAG